MCRFVKSERRHTNLLTLILTESSLVDFLWHPTPAGLISSVFPKRSSFLFFFKFPDLCCSTSRRAVLATSLGNDTSRGSRGNLKAARRQFSLNTKVKISQLQWNDILTQILRSNDNSHVKNNDTSSSSWSSRGNLKAARRQFWQL